MNFHALLAAFFSDRILKEWAKNNLREHVPKTVIPKRLYLLRVRNYGLSGNVLSRNPKRVAKISMIAAFMSTLYALISLRNAPPAIKTAFSLMLGGGLSNLTDRLSNGYVTDFICFKKENTLVYNPADFFIFAGGLFLAVISIWQKE